MSRERGTGHGVSGRRAADWLGGVAAGAGRFLLRDPTMSEHRELRTIGLVAYALRHASVIFVIESRATPMDDVTYTM